ncbi:hypothetical protein DITRI_Ditri12bG0005400 [Diplodiscus trichospermus]
MVQRGIRSPPIQASWCPPPLHFVKLNVDASYEVGTDVAQIGVVLGNHDGLVLLSAVTMISGIVSVLQAELQAILFGGEVFDIIDLSTEFEVCSFIHVHRSANCLADGISRSSFTLSGSCVWQFSLPPDVSL